MSTYYGIIRNGLEKALKLFPKERKLIDLKLIEGHPEKGNHTITDVCSGEIFVDASRKYRCYCFFYGTQPLKIGKAGPGSDTRFFRDHYLNDTSIASSLCKSLNSYSNKQARFSTESINEEWIRKNTVRINIIIVPQKDGVPSKTLFFLMSFIESYLHLQFFPLFEGKTD